MVYQSLLWLQSHDASYDKLLSSVCAFLILCSWFYAFWSQEDHALPLKQHWDFHLNTITLNKVHKGLIWIHKRNRERTSKCLLFFSSYIKKIHSFFFCCSYQVLLKGVIANYESSLLQAMSLCTLPQRCWCEIASNIKWRSDKMVGKSVHRPLYWSTEQTQTF